MPTGLSGWRLQRKSACQDGGGGMVGMTGLLYAPRCNSFAVSRHSMVMHELFSLECFRHGIDAPRQCQWNSVQDAESLRI